MLSQQKTIDQLLERIHFLINGRSSKTSGTPPSQDIGRSNAKSLRPKSDKPSGGQVGHIGKTLEMSKTPDKIEHHMPTYCTSCGMSLEEEQAKLIRRSQEVDLPPIQPIYTEHRSYKKTCSCCNLETTSELPSHLKSIIQYGPSVASAVCYLSTYQYLPYYRITDLMDNFFGLPMSQGTVRNQLTSMSEKATPIYDLIGQRIGKSKVIGSDETGSKISEKKGWFFVWQTESLTYIKASFSRGYNTIMSAFPDGLPFSILVTDCWAAQLKTPSKEKQLCIAHLSRELINFQTAANCNWSGTFNNLLIEALLLKKQLKEFEYSSKNLKVIELENRIDRLLEVDLTDSNSKIKAFAKRMKKHRKSILTFLYHHQVPPDNNGSERAIRNIKVKNKVSGGFRSDKGANQFAILRSVVDTAIKNGCNVFQAFLNIAQSPILETE